MDRMTDPGCQVVTSWSTTSINRYLWRKKRNLDDPVRPSSPALPTGPSQAHIADDPLSRDTARLVSLTTDKNSNITKEGHTQDALLPADDNDNSLQETEQPHEMPNSQPLPHLSRDLSVTEMIMSPNQFSALNGQGSFQVPSSSPGKPVHCETYSKAAKITECSMGGRLTSTDTIELPFDAGDTCKDSVLVSAPSRQSCVNDVGVQSSEGGLRVTESCRKTSCDERRVKVCSSEADHFCHFDGTRKKVAVTSKAAAVTRKKKHQQPKGHVSGEKRRREGHQPLLAHQTPEQVNRSTKSPQENKGPSLTNLTQNNNSMVTRQSPGIMSTLHSCPRRRQYALFNHWSTWMTRAPLGMANRNFDHCYQKKKVRKKEKSKVIECKSAEKNVDIPAKSSTKDSKEGSCAVSVINKTKYRLCSILDKSVDDNENTSSDDNTLVAGVNDCLQPNSPQKGSSDVNCNESATKPAALVNRTSLLDSGNRDPGGTALDLLSDSGSDTCEGFDSDPEVEGQEGAIGHSETTHDKAMLPGDALLYRHAFHSHPHPHPHLHSHHHAHPWLLRTMQGSPWQHRDTLSCPCTPSEGQIMGPIELGSQGLSAPATPLTEGDVALGGPHSSLYLRVFDAVIRCTSSLHLR